MQTLSEFLTNSQCVHIPGMVSLTPHAGQFHPPTSTYYSPPRTLRDRVCPFELLHVFQIVISYGNSLVSEWLLAGLWSHIMSTSCILTRTCICLCSSVVCSDSVQINLQHRQGPCHYLTFHQFLRWLQIWQALSLFSLRSLRSVLNDFGLMRFLLNFQKCFGWDDSSTFTLVLEKQQPKAFFLCASGLMFYFHGFFLKKSLLVAMCLCLKSS